MGPLICSSSVSKVRSDISWRKQERFQGIGFVFFKILTQHHHECQHVFGRDGGFDVPSVVLVPDVGVDSCFLQAGNDGIHN